MLTNNVVSFEQPALDNKALQKLGVLIKERIPRGANLLKLISIEKEKWQCCFPLSYIAPRKAKIVLYP